MFNFRDQVTDVKDATVSSLKKNIHDAEAMLDSLSASGDERFADARARMRESLRAARDTLTDAEVTLREKGREVARVTDDYVHENPYRSIGVAAAVGLLIGCLITTRR